MSVRVAVCPARVNRVAEGAAARVCVMPFMMAMGVAPLLLPRLNVVPETVMRGPLGERVCVPMRISPWGFAVRVLLPMVRIGGLVGLAAW